MSRFRRSLFAVGIAVSSGLGLALFALAADPAPDKAPIPPEELLPVPSDWAALCRQADQIVHARVASAACELDAGGLIWTSYNLKPIETLKPLPRVLAAGQEFKIRQLGGRVGDLRQLASGVAQFAPGEEVVLLTRDFGAGWQSVIGGDAGCLRVAAGTERLAAPLPPALGGGDLALFKRRVRSLAALASPAADAAARSLDIVKEAR